LSDGERRRASRLAATLGRSTERPPLPTERASGAYCATPRRDQRPEPDDDELDDEAAVAAAYREQKRAPTDLIGAVLPR
jgi:hypothetical protein